jgi:hypothetical protein
VDATAQPTHAKVLLAIDQVRGNSDNPLLVPSSGQGLSRQYLHASAEFLEQLFVQHSTELLAE